MWMSAGWLPICCGKHICTVSWKGLEISSPPHVTAATAHRQLCNVKGLLFQTDALQGH